MFTDTENTLRPIGQADIMQSTIIYNETLQNILIELHSLDMAELTPSEMLALAKILQQKTEQLQDAYRTSEHDPYIGYQFDDTAW